MSADRLIQLVTEVPFVIILLVVLVEAARHRTRASIDVALFFGALAAIVVVSWVNDLADEPAGGGLTTATAIALMALPYLLLRIVHDFAGVPMVLRRLGEAGLVASAVLLIVAGTQDRPVVVVELLVLYFVGFATYTTVRFITEAQTASGVTRRRMQAAAAASGLLAAVLLSAGLSAAFPGPEALWTGVSRVAGLLSALAYVVAFAPPRVLRRVWQEPELRRFLVRAAELPRLPDTLSVVQTFEQVVRATTGAEHAAIALCDAGRERLVTPTMAIEDHTEQPRDTIADRAFAQQRAVFVEDAPRSDPAHADGAREAGTTSLMVAPITAGERRLGVLTVFSSRPPLFARDDLELVVLLADQAAVVLESRALIDEASRVRAMEEATRLKDDFLSAAAHDLKTPLTTLVGQAQLMERRARRWPGTPTDLEGVQRMVREAGRMRSLINDLLDASRADQGTLVGSLAPVDLAALVCEVAELMETRDHEISVDVAGPVPVRADRERMAQVFQNLLDNAMKYSPGGGEVSVAVRVTGDDASVTVTDRGIGISAADAPYLFDRFWRSAGLDDRRFAGMGLGLYICRRIVDEHDGRIFVRSVQGSGSTFFVELPLERNGGSE